MDFVTPSIFEVPLHRIDGTPASLDTYRGKALLIVNVASKCGLTPQYEGLERIYSTYRDRGFAVLGFPANDFGEQEPGSNAEIAGFCRGTFGATFPMFEKIAVTGPEKHELYALLIAAQPVAAVGDPGFRAQLDGFLAGRHEHTLPPPEILWNFEKFLVSSDGAVLARFAPDILPDDPRIVQAIEAALPSTA